MTPTSKNSNLPLMIIGVLFFVFGFVTWVNSVLIAFFKDAFDLNNFQSLRMKLCTFVLSHNIQKNTEFLRMFIR